MKGKRLEAHIWSFIGNQTCHQCWKMLAWADSWSLYNPFDFLCVLVSHIHQSIFEVSFCEIDQKSVE